MEKTIRENESLHTTVRLLLEKLVESKETPPPTVCTFLQALNESSERNSNKLKGGERYKDYLSLMSTHFFLLCGPRAYGELHGNLQKIIPCITTVKNTMHKNRQVLVEGQFRWDELSEFLEERGYPREVRWGKGMPLQLCYNCVYYLPLYLKMYFLINYLYFRLLCRKTPRDA